MEDAINLMGVPMSIAAGGVILLLIGLLINKLSGNVSVAILGGLVLGVGVLSHIINENIKEFRQTLFYCSSSLGIFFILILWIKSQGKN